MLSLYQRIIGIFIIMINNQGMGLKHRLHKDVKSYSV